MHSERSDYQELADRFQRDQLDLNTLCAVRPIETNEAWWGNDYYGCATTLKRYAGVQRARSVYAVIPHGVYYRHHYVSPGELDALLPAVLAYPNYRVAAYRERTNMVVIPSASPFVYAATMVAASDSRRGTLFFPAHSTRSHVAQMDWDLLAGKLTRWPEHMRPVTVMMYWQDYLHGHHLPFVKLGFPIVSAGHIYDPDFLLRQAHILKRHAYAASNGVGSHIFSSIHAGCSFWFVEHDHRYIVSETNTIPLPDFPVITPSEHSAIAGIKSALRSEPPRTVTPEQRSLADYYLGTEFVREPDDLAALLDWLEELDRRGPLAFLGGRARRLGLRGVGLGSMVPYRTQRRRRDEVAKSQ